LSLTLSTTLGCGARPNLNPDIACLTLHHVAISDTQEQLLIDSPIPHNRSPRISSTGTSVTAVALDELGIEPDLVKIDIEGYETKALAGAGKTLAKRPVIFIETCDLLRREAGSSADELLGVLDARGYTGECTPASVWVKADRPHPLIPRESERSRKLYRSRGAVEREFGRLKHEWALLPLRVRGLDRVRLHADLTILAKFAYALARTRAVPLAA
jgi:hypothetical protein